MKIRAPKLRTSHVFLTAIVVVLALCTSLGWGVYETKHLRTHPNLPSASNYLTGNWPHHIAGRVILLKPGIAAYNLDIANLAVRRRGFSDNFYNRYLLEKLFNALTDKQLFSVLPQYPLTPTQDIGTLCIKALAVKFDDVADEYPQEDYNLLAADILDLLQRIPGTRDDVENYVETHLRKTVDPDLFVSSIGTLTKHDIVDWPSLVTKYWSSLDEWQQQGVFEQIGIHVAPTTANYQRLRNIALALGLVNGSKANLQTLLPFTQVMRDDSSFTTLLRQNLAVSEIPDSDNDFTGEMGNWDDLDSLIQVVPAGERVETVKYLFALGERKNQYLTAGMFHWLLDQDESLALPQAESILNEPDSSLRKAVIVILVRHNILLGINHLDEAFSGAAPRRTYFTQFSSYVFGSPATSQYEKLAGHPYLGTGKSWQPSSPGTPAQWQDFIDRFPWHPGTDDAYYHLATTLLTQKSYEAFWRTIGEYHRRELPDNDASPYIASLVREAILLNPQAMPSTDYFRLSREVILAPLGSLIDAPSATLLTYQMQIDRLAGDTSTQQLLGISPSTLQGMSAVISGWLTTDPSQRVKLASSVDLGFDENIFARFYGLYFFPSQNMTTFLHSAQASVATDAIAKTSLAFQREWLEAMDEDRTIDGPYAKWCLLHANRNYATLMDSAIAPYFSIFNNVPLENLDYQTRYSVEIAQKLAKEKQ